ncbi:toprim domain-containing protein [bacterium]|nr:toprim domain-containing protein [bacterium]
MDLACKYFNQNLLSNNAALEYLEKRGIGEVAIQKFSLGLAPKGNYDLKKYLTNLGFTVDELDKAGLVYEKESVYYDRFKNRIIIPIKDVNSNTIAFGARAIVDGQTPKYINSPESLIYSKSNVLFGLNLAKDVIKERDSVIFMEGYFDVISAHLGGVENAVATCGTALTTQHIKLIGRYSASRRIYLAFDTDSAGKKAIEHGAEVIKNIFSALGDIKQYDSSYENKNNNVCEIHVVQEIEGKDPDEYIRQFGGEEYLKKVENAPLLLDYQLSQIYKDIKSNLSPQEKSEYVLHIADILYQIQNPVILDEYIKRASYKIDVSENVLKTQVINKQNEMYMPTLTAPTTTPIYNSHSTGQEAMEENIIKLVFSANTIEKFNYIKGCLNDFAISDTETSKILDVIEKKIIEVNNVDELAKKVFFEFYNEHNIENKISQSIISSHEFDNLPYESFKMATDEAIARTNKLKKLSRRDELKKMLKDDTLTPQEKMQISTKIFQELRNL